MNRAVVNTTNSLKNKWEKQSKKDRRPRVLHDDFAGVQSKGINNGCVNKSSVNDNTAFNKDSEFERGRIESRIAFLKQQLNNLRSGSISNKLSAKNRYNIGYILNELTMLQGHLYALNGPSLVAA